MRRHTDIIIWMVNDHIFLGHLTCLNNFHQYRVFDGSRHTPDLVVVGCVQRPIDSEVI